MSRIYLIPGMGTDTRIYSKIHLNNHELIYVNWVNPNKTDTFVSYAQKLIDQYHIKPGSVIIGNSMGGMLAIEIAKKIPYQKVILISSIKCKAEEPLYFKFLRAIPIYKLIPGRVLNATGFLIKPFFGNMNPADNRLFKDMLKKSSPIFLKWGMNAVLHWDNDVVLPNLSQLAGDKDVVFPFKRIKGAILVKGGTHIMIFEKAGEIIEILKEILKNEIN